LKASSPPPPLCQVLGQVAFYGVIWSLQFLQQFQIQSITGATPSPSKKPLYPLLWSHLV